MSSLSAVVALVVMAVTLGARQTGPAIRWNLERGGVAAHGYDVVSYFTDGRPVKGQPAITLVWQGATWQFATPEHRAMFEKAPEKYVPQFGGFCAWAVSRNYTADTDPDAWTIANGRLFLNYSLKVQQTWLQDRDANIAKGDLNWPALSQKK